MVAVVSPFPLKNHRRARRDILFGNKEKGVKDEKGSSEGGTLVVEIVVIRRNELRMSVQPLTAHTKRLRKQ
jgi:hypothetical protein